MCNSLCMVNGFDSKGLCVWWLFLTIGSALLPWVAVVKDALGIVCPVQAAEFDPFQFVRQRREVVGLHEMHRYPVGTTAAQTICKIFTLL